ncbi:6475_t:CDS:2 [Ambispora leptoticha]|uniref:6475_t:CDS:1 n=1 Tax=Ambispora leptoticha TaxID=144679 RepID=A0A9N9AUE4_9GLOM|nr:6475_t:CDS:2 [Ambispora leptoticha]
MYRVLHVVVTVVLFCPSYRCRYSSRCCYCNRSSFAFATVLIVLYVAVAVDVLIVAAIVIQIFAVAMMFKNVIELVMVLCVKGIEK